MTVSIFCSPAFPAHGGRTEENFPYWLLEKAHAKGYAFAAASYSLLPQANAFDMVEDVKALFAFLSTDLPSQVGVEVDEKRIAVIGQSAGGYLCRLAAAHAQPKPCAMGVLWGMVRSSDLTKLHLIDDTGHASDGPLDPTSISVDLYSLRSETSQPDARLDGGRHILGSLCWPVYLCGSTSAYS